MVQVYVRGRKGLEKLEVGSEEMLHQQISDLWNLDQTQHHLSPKFQVGHGWVSYNLAPTIFGGVPDRPDIKGLPDVVALARQICFGRRRSPDAHLADASYCGRFTRRPN
jgi:hypothetical protein